MLVICVRSIIIEPMSVHIVVNRYPNRLRIEKHNTIINAWTKTTTTTTTKQRIGKMCHVYSALEHTVNPPLNY